MQKKLKISIIVPTFNEAKNIKPLIKGIEKVLSSYSYEIIFVDDNSPDGTSNIIKNIANINPNI